MNKNKLKIIVGVAIIGIGGFFFYNKAKAADFSTSVGLSYVTETAHRGQILSEDGLEFEAGVSTTLLESLDASVSLFSKKTFDGADEVRPSIEIGTSIFDSVELGFGAVKYNGHASLDGSHELYLEGGVDIILHPSVAFFHNPDTDLNTIEGSVAHGVELLGQEVNLSAFVGETEFSSTLDSTYYGASASTSKPLNEDLTLNLGVTYVDNDLANSDAETIFLIGVSTSF